MWFFSPHPSPHHLMPVHTSLLRDVVASFYWWWAFPWFANQKKSRGAGNFQETTFFSISIPRKVLRCLKPFFFFFFLARCRVFRLSFTNADIPKEKGGDCKSEGEAFEKRFVVILNSVVNSVVNLFMNFFLYFCYSELVLFTPDTLFLILKSLSIPDLLVRTTEESDSNTSVTVIFFPVVTASFDALARDCESVPGNFQTDTTQAHSCWKFNPKIDFAELSSCKIIDQDSKVFISCSTVVRTGKAEKQLGIVAYIWMNPPSHSVSEPFCVRSILQCKQTGIEGFIVCLKTVRRNGEHSHILRKSFLLCDVA